MSTVPLAKITCPTVLNVVRRRRLFSQLDAALHKPLLWINSAAGSGKTTLVSSYVRERKLPCIWYSCDEGDADPGTFFHYMSMAARKANPRRKRPLPSLTPEYLAGLSTFTKRYFEDLFGRLKPPFLLVVDNHQAVPTDSRFDVMLAQGLDVIPDGITMVIISRHEPPPPFARFHAYNKMTVIGWNDVRFTFEETADVINGRLRQVPPRASVLEVHQKADGWVAAIVLMRERARLGGPGALLPDDVVSEAIFDYFADELLDKTTPETREFLLKTAFLPTISVPLAEQLTGLPNAGRILATLNRQNYFTQRLSGSGQEYQYHPLFRACLMARAKSEIDRQSLAKLIGKAARVLAASAHKEAAASLFVEIGDWVGLARLLTETARSFVLEGRNGTLESYLRKLPEASLAAQPRLLYWLGIARMPFDIEESRTLLEAAFRAFDEAGNLEWAFAAWAAVVDSIITEHNDYTKLDRWIDWLDERDGLVDSLPIDIQREAVAYMLFALTFRRSCDPKTEGWVQRAEEIVRTETDLPGTMIVGSRLLLHYTFFGDVHKAETLLENISPSNAATVDMPVLSLIQWLVITAGFAALGSASSQECLDAVGRGLALSREHGIHVFEPLLLYFGAVCCAVAGDEATADGFLEQMLAMRARFNDMQLAYYISVLAWRDLVRGDARSAAERISRILPVTERFGYTVNSVSNHIGLAQALFELGETKKAKRQLLKARSSYGTNSPWLQYVLQLTEAYFAFKEGREADGLELTGRAMALSKAHGVTVFVYWRPAMLGLICAKALEAGIESDYVRSLVRKHHLDPVPLGITSERWPWPFRIYTLGEFQIVHDDAVIEFSGKAPQKPLELLKALIAFGGRNVPEERLTDELWPDADGDQAHQAFEITLRRLRGLFGGEPCINYGARQLSLDPSRCWVDSLALEHVLRPSQTSDAGVLQRYREAARLYKGEFLPADSTRAWALSRSETLESMMLRLVKDAGRLYERAGEWTAAAACYERGLEADPLAEELYRRLMLCCDRLGRRTDAIRLYQRCSHLLRTHLGIGPSPETEAVHASLLE